jgi:hypothetical protein
VSCPMEGMYYEDKECKDCYHRCLSCKNNSSNGCLSCKRGYKLNKFALTCSCDERDGFIENYNLYH